MITEPAPTPAPSSPPRATPRAAVVAAAAASAGAGIVHAAAAGTHTGDDTLVVLFTLAALAQLGWAALAIYRTRGSVLLAGALLNGGLVLVWALSRTTGLPVVVALADAESVGRQDLIAAALAALSAAAALVAVLTPATLSGPPTATGAASTDRRSLIAPFVIALVLVLAFVGMTAGHTHAADHEHGAADDAHAHTDAEAAVGASDDHPHVASTGPVISLADTRLTVAQRAAAASLIDATTHAMAAFPDEAAVKASGYYSIGDASTGFEHYVSPSAMADGREVDPTAIESIVLKVAPDGTKTVASAMYILNPGKTMADVPDIAGELTTFHDHQNLCWIGGRVVGVLGADGQCPRGEFRATAPMLHVWLTEEECGPFAGIEGTHGAGCAGHPHDTSASAAN